jgi:hypothetical protein
MTIFVSSVTFPTPPRRKTTLLFSCSLLSRVRFCCTVIRSLLNDRSGWKRVLIADTPRQTINALTLYSFYIAKNVGPNHDTRPFYDLSKYSDNFVTTGLIVSLIFTVMVCAGSLLLLLVAGICYIPLLCYIQGNLKVSYIPLM